MNDLDLRLRDAGARLRDSAPSAAATETALASIGDVELDGHGTRRSRLWIVAPAVLAAAAAIVGAIVLTRPQREAVVPADTTLAPAPPSSVVPAPTTTVSVFELGGGVALQTSNEDFDGDGGACLTLSTSTDSALGCADGPTMRSGRPLSLHLDGTPYSFFPQGTEGIGEPTLADEATTCLANVNEAGVLTDIVSCGDGDIGVVGKLPAEPGGAMTWTLVGAERAPDAIGLELLTPTPGPARVFRSSATDQLPACVVIVAVDGSAREACVDTSATLLAGTPEQPVVVAYDVAAGTAVASTLDEAANLAVSGCFDLTAGALLALLPPHGAVESLLCGGDAGLAIETDVLLHEGGPDGEIDVLARDADGAWSVAVSGTGIDCDAPCAEIGIDDVSQVPPFPSISAIGAFGEAVGAGAPFGGRSAPELAAIQSASDLQALAGAIVAELEAQGAEPGQVTVTAADQSPVVIRRANMDEAVTVFTAFAEPAADGGLVVIATRAVDICERGLTTVDGQTGCL